MSSREEIVESICAEALAAVMRGEPERLEAALLQAEEEKCVTQIFDNTFDKRPLLIWAAWEKNLKNLKLLLDCANKHDCLEHILLQTDKELVTGNQSAVGFAFRIDANEIVEELLSVAKDNGLLTAMLSNPKYHIIRWQAGRNDDHSQVLVKKALDLMEEEEFLEFVVPNIYIEKKPSKLILKEVLERACPYKNDIEVNNELLREIKDSGDFIHYITRKVTAHYLFLGTSQKIDKLTEEELDVLDEYTLKALYATGLDVLDIIDLSKVWHEKGSLPRGEDQIQDREPPLEWDSAFKTEDDKNYFDHTFTIDGEQKTFRIKSLDSSEDLMKMTEISRERHKEGGTTLCTGEAGQDTLCAEGRNRYIAIIELNENGQETEAGYKGGMQIGYYTANHEYTKLESFDMRNNKNVRPYHDIMNAFLKHNDFLGFENIKTDYEFEEGMAKVTVNHDAKQTEENKKELTGLEPTNREKITGSSVTLQKFFDKLKFLITHRASPIEEKEGSYLTICGVKTVKYVKLMEHLGIDKDQYYWLARVEDDIEGRSLKKSDGDTKPWNLAKKWRTDKQVCINEDSLVRELAEIYKPLLQEFIYKVLDKDIKFKPPKIPERNAEPSPLAKKPGIVAKWLQNLKEACAR